MNKSLAIAWSKRKKLHAEGYKLHAEGDKLLAEGNELLAEGDKLWDDAVTAVYGKDCKIEWEEGKCILTPENRSITFEKSITFK